MTSLPQTPDGKHIAVAKLVGAGFKPALVPQARCEGIAVISCAIEVRTAKLGSNSHTVNAERGRVCGAPPSCPYKNHQRSVASRPGFAVGLSHMRLPGPGPGNKFERHSGVTSDLAPQSCLCSIAE